MQELFRLGGWGMYPTLVFGLVTFGISAAWAARPDRRLVPLLITSNFVTLLSGMLGFVTGLITTTTHLSDFPPMPAPTVALIGFGESLTNVALALILMILGGLVAAIGAVRLARAVEPAPLAMR